MKKNIAKLFVLCESTSENSSIFSRCKLMGCFLYCYITIAQQIAEKLCFFIILNILPECMDVIYPSNDKSNAEGTIT